MAEWEVFAALVAIVGFCITIFKISGYFNALDSSVKLLVKSMERLNDEMSDINKANRESHQRLWDHNEKQDEQLNDHESRILLIEKRR